MVGETICQCVRASITPSLLTAARGVMLHSWLTVYKTATPELFHAEDRIICKRSHRLMIVGMIFLHLMNEKAARFNCYVACDALKVPQRFLDSAITAPYVLALTAF